MTTQTQVLPGKETPLWEDTEVWQTLKNKNDIKQMEPKNRALMCMVVSNKPVDFWCTIQSLPQKADSAKVQWELPRDGDLIQDIAFQGQVKHSWVEYKGQKSPQADGLLSVQDTLPLIAIQGENLRLHMILDDSSK